ncbi:MAG: PAS domain S-box protein [Candidatus Sericytochromatia bacterium]|nr:PAS domain S-box protein [Candidatus Tanganyikabacteria bacterium]
MIVTRGPMVSSNVLPREPRATFTPHPELRLIGFLHGLFGLLGSRGELGDILRSFLQDIAEYLEAEGGYVLSTDDPDNLRLVTEYGVPFIEESHDTTEISRFYDDLIRKRRPAIAVGSTQEAASLIGVPMLTESRLVGVIVFFRNRDVVPFVAEDIPLLSVVSQPLAIHIENVDFARGNAARRAELEAILASMDDGLVVVDHLGQVLSFNNALATLSAYTVPDLYSMCWDDLVTTSQRHWETFKAFNRCLRQGETFRARCPGAMRRADGSEFPVSMNFSTISEEPGVVTGGVISIRDVTIEAELDRMKDEFIANVSHELKTPITTLSGFLQMMISRDMSRGEQLPLLDVLKDETDRLHRLINDLLDLSKIQANRIKLVPRTFRLETLLRKVIKPFAVRHQDTHKIVLTVEPPRGMIQADHDRLTQVLVNLVSNAVKYSPEGGEVSIRAGRKGDKWFIAVKDQGIGIAADVLPQLFTRFYRVNENQTAGTGLGLFITKEIVERHGGKLEVASQLGEGSTFTVEIPVKFPAPEARNRPPADARR